MLTGMQNFANTTLSLIGIIGDSPDLKGLTVS